MTGTADWNGRPEGSGCARSRTIRRATGFGQEQAITTDRYRAADKH